MKKSVKKKEEKAGRELKKIEKVLYAILVGFGVITFWRGLWRLWDAYVYPDNLKLSAWISVIVGLAILILTHKIIKELM